MPAKEDEMKGTGLAVFLHQLSLSASNIKKTTVIVKAAEQSQTSNYRKTGHQSGVEIEFLSYNN